MLEHDFNREHILQVSDIKMIFEIANILNFTDKTFYVESDTEELYVISKPEDVDRYILKFGNQKIVGESGKIRKNYFSVPAFAEKRQLYSEAKAKDCAIWGCE